jgi:AraC-like DNA-binding protein
MPQELARSEMLSITRGFFREPDDFEAAMRDDGCTNLVVTQRGPFRARLNRIALHWLRLQSAEESCARVAFFTIPAGSTLVFIPVSYSLPPVWDGASTCEGEIITVSGGHRAHTRSATGGRWGTLLLPTRILESHAETLTGSSLILPPGVAMWRPSVPLFRQLIRLHMSATGVASTRASMLTTSEPARSLEQELMGGVIACLLEGNLVPRRRAHARHGDVMARFEDLLVGQPTRSWTLAALSEALDISGRFLRICCDEHLGMGPNAYIRLRRMQLVRRALGHADPAVVTVAQVAAAYGFSEAGRFSGAYRTNFGELPSATLRRGAPNERALRVAPRRINRANFA